MPYADPIRAREYARSYYDSDYWRNKNKEAQRRYRQSHTVPSGTGTIEQRQARRAARVLGPHPCEACGAPDAQRHHYRGYAPENWLDVVWLCPVDHKRLHKENDR